MQIEFKKDDTVSIRTVTHLIRYIPKQCITIDWNDITFKQDVTININVEVGE